MDHMDGCPVDDGTVGHLRWTLLYSMDTSPQLIEGAGHVSGSPCRCSECTKLKTLEDKWICRLGTFYAAYWLNSRDQESTIGVPECDQAQPSRKF